MKRTVCAWCKRPFDAHRVTAKYCSSSCRARASENARQTGTQALGAPPQRRRSTALASALTRALARTKTTRRPGEAAAVALARVYARAIDADPDTLRQLGPQYLKVLTALGMTSREAGRTAAPPAELDTSGLARAGRAAGEVPSALDELRARRAQRADWSDDTPAADS